LICYWYYIQCIDNTRRLQQYIVTLQKISYLNDIYYTDHLIRRNNNNIILCVSRSKDDNIIHQTCIIIFYSVQSSFMKTFVLPKTLNTHVVIYFNIFLIFFRKSTLTSNDMVFFKTFRIPDEHFPSTILYILYCQSAFW